MAGAGGQITMIVPSHDLVVARVSATTKVKRPEQQLSGKPSSEQTNAGIGVPNTRHWASFYSSAISMKQGKTKYSVLQSYRSSNRRSTAGEYAAVPDRYGGLCWCPPSQPEASGIWSRYSADAGEVCASLLEGTEERFS